MNLFFKNIKYKSINRFVLPEAKQKLWQTWLWLKKMGSESYIKLFFSYLVRFLIKEIISSILGNPFE